MLMEAISSGQLFKVVALCALLENCTATSSSIIPSVEAGKSCENLFTSPTKVDCSRSLLDNYASEIIVYERKETRYGEAYFINFEAALCLSIGLKITDERGGPSCLCCITIIADARDNKHSYERFLMTTTSHATGGLRRYSAVCTI
jgi:hypothetical protein